MTHVRPSFSTPELSAKFRQMAGRLEELGRVLVAFSGGVDSTLVLKLGTMVLGENCIGVTARSETLTDGEFELTRELAREHRMRQEIVEYSELEIANYAENPINRCFFCKHELYSRLDGLAERWNAVAVLDGTNADDVGDYRPGQEAARQLQVVSLLREAGMTKADIRAMARELGLANWDKPSGACLSSRIPYGQTIDRAKLDQVAKGEAFLRSLGFRQVRVRHHDRIARIEVEPAEIPRLAHPEIRKPVEDFLRSLGFLYVVLDLAGYRTGSLNEALGASPAKTAPPVPR